MGYLPIIIMLAGFSGLFWLVVNQSILAKKKSILQLQQAFFDGLEKSGSLTKNNANLSKESLRLIDSEYQKVKSNLTSKTEPTFQTEIKPIYQSLKISVSQYNKLIDQKPYSFVAKGMGHKQIG
jgi:hypothetical protein